MKLYWYEGTLNGRKLTRGSLAYAGCWLRKRNRRTHQDESSGSDADGQTDGNGEPDEWDLPDIALEDGGPLFDAVSRFFAYYNKLF